MIYLVDDVLAAISQTLAAQAPELGGALLGLPGRPVITHFIFDEGAETTRVSYSPSRTLNQRVKESERAQGLEFKGIIHSHPAGFDRPSAQDEIEIAQALKLNPHMAFYLAPIVTHRKTERLRDHEIGLSGAILSVYVANRGTSGRAEVQAGRIEVLQIRRDLNRIATQLDGEESTDLGIVEWEHRDLLARRILLRGGIEILLLFSEQYPILPPLALLTASGSGTEQLDLAWSVHTPQEDRLLYALTKHIKPPGPYRRVFGPPDGSAVTDDGNRAALAGWTQRFSGEDVQNYSSQVRAALFERSRGLLSNAIHDKKVLIAGVGSVGSYLSEQLVRSGVGHLTIVDPDTVEASNLARTSYSLADLGQPKVCSLKRRILNLNPSAQVETHTVDIVAMARQRPREFNLLIQQMDLIIAATDDPEAQRLLNHFSYARNCPALFIGLYAGAQGGEVVISQPGQTACFVCATINRHQMEEQAGQVSPSVDYGTGRLQGEVALAADIHHVSSAGVKLALSLLVRHHPELKLSEFCRSAIEQGYSYLTLSMVPEYWFYPHIFGTTPGQHAYQSVWLTVHSRPECTICGQAAVRIDPATTRPGGPSLPELRRRLAG